MKAELSVKHFTVVYEYYVCVAFRDRLSSNFT